MTIKIIEIKYNIKLSCYICKPVFLDKKKDGTGNY